MTMERILTETNNELCECGIKHDYAVVDKNIVWYCVTSDGYYVREYVRDYEGHTFDVIETGELVSVHYDGVAIFDIAFSYAVHATQKNYSIAIVKAMVRALNEWET